MQILVVAEKPSVAQDLAEFLGAGEKKAGYWQSRQYLVSWCIGHLLRQAQPGEIDRRWQHWRREDLPMIPKTWPLMPIEQTLSQYKILTRLMNSAEVSEIICATDAGREGELIFRNVYEHSGCTKVVKRLWVSSLTHEGLRKGFRELKPAQAFDGLANSATCRSRADWLVGLNLSRAYSIALGCPVSLGRVQTPTLSLVAKRDEEIADFVATPYCELFARFFPPEKTDEPYEGVLAEKDSEQKHYRRKRLLADEIEAQTILKACIGKTGQIFGQVSRDISIRPPLLYDLGALQRDGNRLFGFTSQKTLDLAQKLYETKKLISYPRTDCPYLSSDVAAQAPELANIICERYPKELSGIDFIKPPQKPFTDDSKITDHHGIIPTGVVATHLDADLACIYDLICRRFLSIWLDDYVYATTTVLTKIIYGPQQEAIFLTQGQKCLQLGWKILEYKSKRSNKEDKLIPMWVKADINCVLKNAEIKQNTTKPPASLTEATLLSGMESAGATLSDKKLSLAMKDKGLGTAATRAAIIEGLCQKDLLIRDGKALHTTDKAKMLLAAVLDEIKSPELTGEWESALTQMSKGDGHPDEFIARICAKISDWVMGADRAKNLRQGASANSELPPSPRLRRLEPSSSMQQRSGKDRHAQAASAVGHLIENTSEPRSMNTVERGGLRAVLQERFGLQEFRPFQEDICEASYSGKNCLVVMPTGAGKSLCYQIPAFARSGTGLIISPLIALMEDQVFRLRKRGFAAAAIHSGKDREESRENCRRYLRGELDFLYVAPERLGLPGFLEILASKKPSLITIDEAHCISAWGHDFRGDYRRLGERLKMFAGVPIMAVTATATARVQEDIVMQLSILGCERYICGFRRDNIAIEVVFCEPKERSHILSKYLKNHEVRPAIVYAPTRKEAEVIAKQLSTEFAVDAYHAGMPTADRSRVSEHFFRGTLDVIVATVAFGMGVDKSNVRSVIHLSQPSSMAGYYQEIGRAGRDGLPSRAVLLTSIADRRIQLYLHDLNYPEPQVLEKVLQSIPPAGLSRMSLESSQPSDAYESQLQKLWIHGALAMDSQGALVPSGKDWKKSYLAQKNHRLAELADIQEFAQNSKRCRMLQIIDYFKDQLDDQDPCGKCDVCDGESTAVKAQRTLNAKEIEATSYIYAMFEQRSRWAKGSLWKEIGGRSSIDKNEFATLLQGLVDAGFLQQDMADFEKSGKTISYLELTRKFKPSLQVKQAMLATTLWAMEDRAPPVRRTRSRAPAVNQDPQMRVGAVSANYPKLVDALKEWRSSKAKEEGVPAYRVIHNRCLYDVAALQPKDLKSLAGISGLGEHKVSHYGRELLAILADA